MAYDLTPGGGGLLLYILRPFLPRGYRPPTAELRSIDQGELRSIDQYIPVHSYLRYILTAEAPGWFYPVLLFAYDINKQT